MSSILNLFRQLSVAKHSNIFFEFYYHKVSLLLFSKFDLIFSLLNFLGFFLVSSSFTSKICSFELYLLPSSNGFWDYSVCHFLLTIQMALALTLAAFVRADYKFAWFSRPFHIHIFSSFKFEMSLSFKFDVLVLD